MADVLTFSHQKSVSLQTSSATETGYTNWYQLPSTGIAIISFTTSEGVSGDRNHDDLAAQLEIAASTTDGASASAIQTAFESNTSAEIFNLSHVGAYGAISYAPLQFFIPGEVSGDGTTYIYIRFTDNVKHFIYQSIDSSGSDTITSITS